MIGRFIAFLWDRLIFVSLAFILLLLESKDAIVRLFLIFSVIAAVVVFTTFIIITIIMNRRCYQ